MLSRLPQRTPALMSQSFSETSSADGDDDVDSNASDDEGSGNACHFLLYIVGFISRTFFVDLHSCTTSSLPSPTAHSPRRPHPVRVARHGSRRHPSRRETRIRSCRWRYVVYHTVLTRETDSVCFGLLRANSKVNSWQRVTGEIKRIWIRFKC